MFLVHFCLSLLLYRLDSADFARLNEARQSSSAAGTASGIAGAAITSQLAFKKRFPLNRELSREHNKLQQQNQGKTS
jgi:hypothetical protein